MTKLVALCTSQGTACSETILTSREDTPTNRQRIEAMYCRGNSDDAPVKGTWTDVTDNDAFADLLADANADESDLGETPRNGMS